MKRKGPRKPKGGDKTTRPADRRINVERTWKRDKSTNIMTLFDAITTIRIAWDVRARLHIRRRLLRGEVLETTRAFFRVVP